MRLPRLVEPTTAELRLLRPSSLALWRALIRCRDRGSMGEGEWFCAPLWELARWARIAYSTATHALNQLKRAGLVATSRCSRSRWFRDRATGHLVTGNALEENMYLVAGSLRTRYGVDEVRVPARAWRSFTASPTRATAPWRADPFRVEWLPEWSRPDVANGPGSLSPGAGLGPQTGTSVCIEEKTTGRENDFKKAPSAFLSSHQEPKEIDPDVESRVDEIIAACMADDDGPTPPAHDDRRPSDRRTFVAIGGRGPRLVPRPGDPPSLPPDQHERPPCLVTYVSPEQLPELKALQVVVGFRDAVREVYGVEWWHYSKGDIRRAKHYDRLLKCGEALADHSVPARHWAIWRLRWFKSIKRWAERPPPVWIVMSGKTVSERAGWFRKEYDLPVATFKLDPIINEQNLRNREASRRHQGHSDDTVFVASFPRWYVDKRLAEIAGGMDSPHDCWPTKPGSRYGKTITL